MDSALADAPPDLVLRVRSALPEGWRDVKTADSSDIALRAAVNELRVLIERGCDTRGAAPGLLAVDALVTQACELAARAGEDIDAASGRMISQIVSVNVGKDATR